MVTIRDMTTVTEAHLSEQGPKFSSCCAKSVEDLESRLTRALGAVVGGRILSRTLGYRTQSAFRQALARKRLPVPIFVLEGRRGRFAYTGDIARWLWPKLKKDSTRQPRREDEEDAAAQGSM